MEKKIEKFVKRFLILEGWSRDVVVEVYKINRNSHSVFTDYSIYINNSENYEINVTISGLGYTSSQLTEYLELFLEDPQHYLYKES